MVYNYFNRYLVEINKIIFLALIKYDNCNFDIIIYVV